MKYYGQNNEDRLLLEYFQNENPADLCILDIGANDGKTFSNSLACIENGWNAALIEPSPKALNFLSVLHSGNDRVQIYPYAISKTEGKMSFFESGEMIKNNDVALVSSIHANETQKWRDAGIKFETITVECIQFEKFMQKSQHKKFDAISIDCEGEDLNVLKQINLEQLACRFLIVEFNGKDEALYRIHAEYFGLTLIDKNPENLIFCKK